MTVFASYSTCRTYHMLYPNLLTLPYVGYPPDAQSYHTCRIPHRRMFLGSDKFDRYVTLLISVLLSYQFLDFMLSYYCIFRTGKYRCDCVF